MTWPKIVLLVWFGLLFAFQAASARKAFKAPASSKKASSISALVVCVGLMALVVIA